MSTSSRVILFFAVALAACMMLVSAAPVNNAQLEAGSSINKRKHNITTTTTAKASAPIAVKKNASSSSSGSFSGDGTYYAPGLGSCGWDNSDTDLIAALNHVQMANGANSNNNPTCGKTITVNGPNGSVNLKIVDTCPGCANGDIDMSPTAFAKIADMAAGRVPITWSFD